MFSGQGSQYYQMGRKLFETHAGFRDKMRELDEVSKNLQGKSVVDALYDPARKLFEPFTQLDLTHPAIFMTGVAMAQVLKQEGIMPDYLVGFSLGEFTAAALSGALTETAALELVIKQAQLVQQHCQPGEMVAVLHSPEVYEQTPALNLHSTIASINGPAQFTIAGERKALETVRQFMKDNDMLHQQLMVAYGFHSPAIEPAGATYESFLQQQSCGRPSTPVISGMSGQPVEAYPASYFWDIVRKPALFVNAIQALEKLSRQQEQLLYIDLGPAGNLANLVKYNVPAGSSAKGFQVMSPFQQEIKKLEELTGYYKAHQPAKPALRTAKSEPLQAYLFPGQGSQRKGMGEELFQLFPALTDKASEILGYSVKELCLDPNNRNLNLTQYTQPALFVVNALSYLKLKEESGIIPGFVTGHSLGEYNALFAAEVFDFETGLRLVQKRGELMASMKEGGMAAVKGLNEEEIKAILRRHHLEEMDVANYNSHNQIVLSGPKELINKSGHYFEAAGATLYFVLNVSGAFHSRYMLPARNEFAFFLQQFRFNPAAIPVVSNVEASLYSHDRAHALLADQLVKPVRWTDSVQFMIGQGVAVFKEVGPGDVLTKLVYSIQRDMKELV